MTDKLKEAIEVLKQHKSTTDKFNHTVGNVKVSEAIDTVVSELEKPLHTDENIKLFSEWCGKSYIRCEGGWWHRYNPQTLENIITTDTLLKWWNERNYTEKETTE